MECLDEKRIFFLHCCVCRRTRTEVVDEIANSSAVIDYSFLGRMQVHAGDGIGFIWGESRWSSSLLAHQPATHDHPAVIWSTCSLLFVQLSTKLCSAHYARSLLVARRLLTSVSCRFNCRAKRARSSYRSRLDRGFSLFTNFFRRIFNQKFVL